LQAQHPDKSTGYSRKKAENHHIRHRDMSLPPSASVFLPPERPRGEDRDFLSFSKLLLPERQAGTEGDRQKMGQRTVLYRYRRKK